MATVREFKARPKPAGGYRTSFAVGGFGSKLTNPFVRVPARAKRLPSNRHRGSLRRDAVLDSAPRIIVPG